MLARILEPEVMASPEEARDYDAMDHVAVNRVFVADFLAVWHGRLPLLDLGTGTAQIPIALCREEPRAQVLAIDLSGSMLALARVNVRRAGFDDRIRLERCDAKQLPFSDGSFAAVFSNSIVHHVAHPETVLREAVRVTQPGGLLFLRDLLRPDDEAAVQRLVKTYFPGASAHQHQMFADSLRAALSLAELRDLVATFGFDPDTARQTTDRHWTWTLRLSAE